MFQLDLELVSEPRTRTLRSNYLPVDEPGQNVGWRRKRSCSDKDEGDRSDLRCLSDAHTHQLHRLVLCMKMVLRIHNAWTVIDPGTDKNKEQDYLAMGLLYHAIPESLIMQIGDVKSSKALLESINTMQGLTG